jgi:AcrR family transcriptional regulator
MSTNRKSTELRKVDIAQSVIAVLSAVGFKGLTIRSIAERMNVTSAALYFHIKNKEEMIDLAIEEYRMARLELLTLFRVNDKKPLDKIREMLSKEILLAKNFPGFTKFLISENLTVRQLTVMFDLDLYYRVEHTHIFKEAQKLGHIRNDMDPDNITKLYRSILFAGIVKHVLGNEENDLQKEMDMIFDTFFQMLKG